MICFFFKKLAEFSLRHLFQLFQIEEKKLSTLYLVQLYIAYAQLDIQFDVLSYGSTNKLENEITIFVGDTAKLPLFVDLIFPVTESA